MKFLKTLTFLTLLLAFLIYSVLTQGLLSASSLLIIFNIPVLWLILFKKNKFKTILPKAAIISVMLSLIILSNFKPAYPYIISEVSLPQIQYGVESRPLNIIVGEGGNLYFTEQYGGKIGQLNPLSNEITEWSIPSNLLTSEPWDLNYISGGEIFFTDYRQNKIIKLTLSNQITQWDIPTPNSGPRGIFAKSSNEIWFTEFLAGKIAKLNIASSPNKFYEYSLPSGSQPNDIVVVSDKVWVTDFGRDKITCLDSTTGEIIEYSLPTGSKPYGITLDPNGMIWFTLYGRNMIGKLNPWNREVTEYKPIPTANSQPTGITIDDATGNIWFTESAGHKIGKYVPGENMFYEYPTLTSSSTPMGITLYRDSNNKLYVWFTEWAANKLGEIIEGENTGPTTTITTSQLTTVATGKYSVATSKTTLTSSEGGDTPSPNPILPNEYSVETTTTTLTNTAFKLSTSTMATSMNYITEVMHTSVTVTSTSTTYVSTISLTTTTTSTSYSTSYTGTSSITYTTTLHETVYTSTMSLTSSTTQTLPSTLKTTVWFTSYKSTIPTTVFTTYKSTVYSTNVYTVYSTSTLTVTTASITISPTTTLPINTSCFIALAAYNSSLAEPVQVLRSFRDNLVLKTFAGGSFMKVFNAWYYSFSPEIASFISKSPTEIVGSRDGYHILIASFISKFPTLKLLTRIFIYPLIGILTLASLAYRLFAFNPELAITITGLIASGFIGIVYFTPITLLTIYPLKHKALKNKRKILTYAFTFWLISFPMMIIAEAFKAELIMKIASSMLVLTTITLSAVGLSFILLKFIKNRFFR